MNIVLYSEAGGGKDLLGERVAKKYGYTRYAFADEVRTVAEKYFPDLYGHSNNKSRSLLQSVGTKFREIDEDAWIHAMFKKIDARRTESKRFGYTVENVVVTDCRMPNEYEELRNRGFTFVKVVADENTRLERMKKRGDVFVADDLKHHTESFYDSFEYDYLIENTGTPEEAYDKLDNIISMISASGERC